EVWVRGAHVNRRYVNNPEANQRYKVPAPDGTVWHRTGDIARMDRRGRLWLLGRVGEGVERAGRTLWPFPIEIALADVSGGQRAAFVDGQIVVELSDEKAMQAVQALLPSIGMEGTPVRAIAKIPVDARHNSKIDRPALRKLLAGPLRAA